MSLLYTCRVKCDSCGVLAAATPATYPSGIEMHARLGAADAGWGRSLSNALPLPAVDDLCPECLKKAKGSKNA